MKIKVSDLGKKIGVSSKEIISVAENLNISVKAANSNLEEKEAEMIQKKIEKAKSPQGKTEEVKVVPKSKISSDISAKFEKRMAAKHGKNSDKTVEEAEEKPKEEEAAHISKTTDEKAREQKEEGGKPVSVKNKKSKKADTEKEAVKRELPQKTSDKPAKPRGPVIVKRASEIEAEEKARKEAVANRKKAEKAAKHQKKGDSGKDGKTVGEGRKKAASDGREHSRHKNYHGDKEHRGHGDSAGREESRGRRQNKFGKKSEGTEEVLAFTVKKSAGKNARQKQNGNQDSFRDERLPKKPKKKEKREKHSIYDAHNHTHYGEISLEKRAKKKYQKAKVKEEQEASIEETLEVGTILINVPITVAGYCEQVGVSVSQVIMNLMKLGIVTNINANLDETTVTLLSEELGVKVAIGNVEEETKEEGIEDFKDRDEDLHLRSPIITVMGHVDHGKTSLLDAIRATNVIAQESGGITQHIGASEVKCNGHKIVFLDTPGHEAFTAMRARGANITDIAVLVVAADDSVKPQTVESISHAKAAGVPIIVAMNKMDKPGANPDKVKQDLSEHGLIVEDWGGDIICVPVSAKTGDGIEQLLEMILLQAEVLELKANPKRKAMGTVIEARLDKSKGSVATLLVTNGSMKSGMSLVVGTTSGRIRLMTDFKGEAIKKAGPATAVEILGLTDVPAAGDDFHVVEDDKTAREIAEKRKQKLREEVLARNASSTLEELFSQIQTGERKELNLIIKADVRGSVGAIISSLEKLSNEEVKVKIVHSGVGTVTESDITLASTAGAIVIGFNVRPSANIVSIAERENVQIRTYRVIYDIIDDIENAMKGLLDPEFKEVILGQVEIRETFKVPGIGTIGGAYVTDGKIVRNGQVRIVRDGIVIHEGSISSLKRFKDDVREVAQGYECGIGIDKYNDMKAGDIIECFAMEEIERE